VDLSIREAGMKVAIGAVAGTIGGPATYAVELVRALAAAYPTDTFTVLTDRPHLFGEFAATVELPLASAWSQPIWDHWRVRRALARGSFDLYHGTKGVLPRATRRPCVVTIHDLASYVMPASFSRAQRLHLRLETPFALRRARTIITVSASTASDIARLFPAAASRVTTIPEAAPSRARPAADEDVARWRADHGIEGPCIGYLGTLQPRKNVDLLAEAFARAAGARPWTLLIAGRLRPGYRPAFLEGSDARVRYLGPIADEEVPLFFGALSCMVSPSSYEGFGLTFLEAMACGCPVIGLANSSVPEVVGDAGVLLQRPDVDDLADAIESVVIDVPYASELSARGQERAGLFSWEETAHMTRDVYARVLAESPST